MNAPVNPDAPVTGVEPSEPDTIWNVCSSVSVSLPTVQRPPTLAGTIQKYTLRPLTPPPSRNMP